MTASAQQSLDAETETLIAVAHTMRGAGFDASEDGTGRGTPLVPVAFSVKDRGGDAMEDCSPTLRAGGFTDSHQNGGIMPAVAFDAQAGGNTGLAIGEEVAGTLHGGGSHGGRAAVATRWAVRRLTPAECEAL